MLQPGQERGGWQHLDARGGQFDGQRQSVEALADGRDRGGILRGQREVRHSRRGPLDKQRHGRYCRAVRQSPAPWSAPATPGEAAGTPVRPAHAAAPGSSRARRPGHAARSAAISGAAARTCSQLSRTSRSRFAARRSPASRVRGDLPSHARRAQRRWWEDQCRIGQGERSTKTTPSTNGRAGAATSTARRVLPDPPGPVRVTNRPSSLVEFPAVLSVPLAPNEPGERNRQRLEAVGACSASTRASKDWPGRGQQGGPVILAKTRASASIRTVSAAVPGVPPAPDR